ncbi:MAG: biotin synthase BioB [Muribaculaceae bacterium]|nr:biotin synthase BioB [Muribaculaceae bacterium]MDE6754585.1 biotin synthase BioB [Muribaculaceae bacterium]
MPNITDLKNKILEGGQLSKEEALSLAEITPDKYETLWQAAEEITSRLCDKTFDSCSIVNARSGRCPENCKWCAQSAHHKTNIESYSLISRDDCMKAAEMNRKAGIRRFSMVTSGRKMQGRELDTVCEYYKQLKQQGGLNLCASMGLLDSDDLKKLYESGVTRYHCNLEAAPSFFPSLCSTHTVEDKIKTILAAKEIGFEVCSGGIIGMGETPRQRIELALELLRVDPQSIPINILCPIPGTPLEHAAPLSPEEVLNTISFFRFIHPSKTLRFAGGRANLPKDVQLRAMRIGMNGGIMGDMLTTIGSKVEEDKQLIKEGGYKY